MSHTITTRIALFALIGACAGVLFLTMPQYSSAHGGKDDGHASSTATSTKKMKTPKNVDATCMQTAVATREAALATAWDTFASDMKAALSARKSALNDAWGLSDVKARNKALTSAWKTWKKDAQEGHKDLKTTRKSAWDTFKNTAKTSCKVETPKGEALGADAAGSISL